MDAPLHLRPMSIGEILDRSFRLYRNHFRTLFVAVLVVMCIDFIALQIYMVNWFVPFLQFLQHLTTDRIQLPIDNSFIVHVAVGTLVFLLVHALLNLLYLGALIHLISDTFLEKPISITDAY